MRIGRFIKPFVPSFILVWRQAIVGTKPLHKRLCPVCSYSGFFSSFGRPPRLDAHCPKCGSLERHRLFWLWFERNQKELTGPVLHFAPEKVLGAKLRSTFEKYQSADLYAEADISLDIENIDIQDSSVNTVICNHVLEHVDDRKALAEIYRILSDEGKFVVSVPIVDGWDRTYENPRIIDPHMRELHFGQGDHVRYYGRDFIERLSAAGFSKIEVVTAAPTDVVDYGLLRGEKFFVCSKI